MTELTYQALKEAVAGGAAAIRSTTRLQPAGGPGTKVFPPTYGTSEGESRYAFEDRVVAGQKVRSVVLDSVASQANRMEQALREIWEHKPTSFPVAFVDFSQEEGLRDIDRITVLDAPHRIADAIFRDSLYNNTLFRLSDVGRAITESRPGDAIGLLTWCPTALLFGQWDSTGPKGGLGAKFQRAIVAEIIAHGVQEGVKTSSRIDPLGIEKKAGLVYESLNEVDRWTLDPSLAKKDAKGNPVLLAGSGDGGKGAPSNANHGNIAPSIDRLSGGITIEYAEQSAVLSLAALRRLRFPVDIHGQSVSPENRQEVEIAARTCLAALGVLAMTAGVDNDFDLRSRCLLIPEAPTRFELLSRSGAPATAISVSTESAKEILDSAANAARQLGVGWHQGEIRLLPSPKLLELIRRSRALKATGEAEGE